MKFYNNIYYFLCSIILSDYFTAIGLLDFLQIILLLPYINIIL